MHEWIVGDDLDFRDRGILKIWSISFQIGEDDELSCLGFESDETEGYNDEDWTDWQGDLSGAVCLFW